MPSLCYSRDHLLTSSQKEEPAMSNVLNKSDLNLPQEREGLPILLIGKEYTDPWIMLASWYYLVGQNHCKYQTLSGATSVEKHSFKRTVLEESALGRDDIGERQR